MTNAERALWKRIGTKQILGVPFNRQKVVGDYIVDFFASRVLLVIEIDGGQHWEEVHREKDLQRDRVLRGMGLEVLRFSNLEVLQGLDTVVLRIFTEVRARLGKWDGGGG